jgi:hypothetical protein
MQGNILCLKYVQHGIHEAGYETYINFDNVLFVRFSSDGGFAVIIQGYNDNYVLTVSGDDLDRLRSFLDRRAYN